MASPPQSSVNQNRRINPVSNRERMRMFGSNSSPLFPGAPLPSHYLNTGTQNISSDPSVPPPVPPRVDALRSSRYSNYNSYSNPYSMSPYSRLGAGGMYGGYGGYRTPYSRFGMPPDSHSSFVQLAEESTRPAFESIESVVDIVGSISMMLESTYHAVYSSYNAILGVVDQFSRLRDHLAEALRPCGILSIEEMCDDAKNENNGEEAEDNVHACTAKSFSSTFHQENGLRKDNPSVEAAWKTARSVSENSDFSSFHDDKKSPWPFLMFVGLVIGAPWLMFKLLSRSVAKKPCDISTWKENNGYLMATGNYDFNSNRRGEISFRAGEHLYIAPKRLQVNVPKGWMLACNKNRQVGFIPRNYLRTQAAIVQPKSQPASNSLQSELQVQPILNRPTNLPKAGPVNIFGLDDEPPCSSENMLIPPSEEENMPIPPCEVENMPIPSSEEEDKNNEN